MSDKKPDCPDCESPGHNRFDPERVYRYRVVPTRPRMLRDGSTDALEIDGEWVRASDYDQLYEAADKLASAVDKWRHSFATPDNIGPDDDELVAALAAFREGESDE